MSAGAVAPADTAASVEAVAHGLLRRYDEPHRSYHTRVHLAEMHSAFGELADDLDLGPEHRLVGRLAIWFHDAVYDVRAPAGVTEADSAQLADATLEALGAPTDLVADVHALVIATADHRIAQVGPLRDVGGALLDADLWILAAPAARFDAYCAQVREEYAFVDDATYATARSTILRDLLDRPRLYVSDRAHRAWTDAARANVDRELARLQS